MNSRERMTVALSGGRPDRVPVFLRDLTLGLDATGYTTTEVCAGAFDAEKSARSVIALQRMLGHDAVVGSIQFCGMEVEPMGGRLTFPVWGVPSILEPPLHDPEAVERASCPDPQRDAPLSNMVRSYELVNQRIGTEVGVFGNIEGPLTKAGIVRGLDTLSLDLVTNRDIFEKVVRLSTNMATDLSEALSKDGINLGIFLASATDNPDLFGAEVYRHYTLPNLRRIVEAVREDGYPTVFHPHGVFTADASAPLVDETLSTGICGFQFAESNDLGAAKRRWGERTCILGGVNAFTTLLLGPLDTIRAETARCLNSCSPGGGYVMMCSCSLHRGMPLDHVRAMVETCAARGDCKNGGGGPRERGELSAGGHRRRWDWAECPVCGHRYHLVQARGTACRGCPSAPVCGMTRCPGCDTERPVGRPLAARLGRAVRGYRAQFGYTAHR